MVSARQEKMSVWEILFRICQGLIVGIPVGLLGMYVWDRSGNKWYCFWFFILFYILVRVLINGFKGDKK